MNEQRVLTLDFRAEVAREYPAESAAAWEATNAILEVVEGRDFSALAKHSPGLENYPWRVYLELSVLRLARAGAMLRRAGIPAGGRVLDFGSYFGNFALFARGLGYEVDAADNYGSYDGAFDGCLRLLERSGARVLALAGGERNLAVVPEQAYDAVLCCGVIEHVPHTPKGLLEALDRALKPGGALVLETPNLAYVYKREKLAAGESIFPPIELQFHVTPPFEGHHREYVSREIAWMLREIGHAVDEIELFNFSLYGLSELRGPDLERFERMQADPELRELIMMRSTSRRRGEENR
jgi:SAM-dependent methyltransferase